MGSDSEEEDGETGSTIFFLMILCLGSENSISFA